VRKAPYMEKPFGLRIKINWKKFTTFIEDFALKDIPLEEKYEYILSCRARILGSTNLMENYERVQNGVKEICKDELTQIRVTLEKLLNNIKITQERLLRIIRKKRKIRRLEPLAFYYLSEMSSALQTLVSFSEEGRISSCYREMRKILEDFSWIIFDDLLLFKMSTLVPEILSPYHFISKGWFNWAKNIGHHLIKNKDELKKAMADLVEQIYTYGLNQEYNWRRKQIEDSIFKGLTLSLFLLLTGRKKFSEEELSKLNEMKAMIPVYSLEELSIIAVEDLKQIISGLKNSSLTGTDIAFVEKLVKSLKEKAPEVIIPPYPTNKFIFGFLGKVFSARFLERKYSEYSQFVHTYFTSWQVFPFSSVLEFKVFNHELSVFAENILQLINSYLEHVFGLKRLREPPVKVRNSS
jgi:hypothetical protein